MHDWGDMLVHAGFAEPVMDMERITLSYSTPQSLCWPSCVVWGATYIPQRFAGLRSRAWLARLHAALAQGLVSPAGEWAPAGDL